jgi:hypothetical protein
MTKIGRITLSILGGSVLAITTWALPQSATNGAPQATAQQNQVRLESASGTIVAVESDFFTLSTAADNPQGQQFMAGSNSPKAMTFLIDNNTTVDGKMTVGATASVIYREANGNNLAVNVIVAR